MNSKDLIFTHPGPKTSITEIDAFERKFGAKLPEDYREFLLLHNGGVSEALESKDPFLSLRHWFSICDEQQERPPIINSLWGQYTDRSGEYGGDYLGIGFDVAGKDILIKLRGENMYSIHYWNWERDIDDPKCIRLMFKSFTDMFDNLEYSDWPKNIHKQS
jgi:hypothetical protein